MSEEVDVELSLLHEAAKRGYPEQIKEELKEHPKDLDKADHGGNTPLLWACSGGHYDAVALLVNLGANVNAVNQFGDTALHRAAWKGHEKICKLLIEKGAGKCRDIKNKDGKRPIDLARRFEVQKVVAPLVQADNEQFDQEDADSD